MQFLLQKVSLGIISRMAAFAFLLEMPNEFITILIKGLGLPFDKRLFLWREERKRNNQLVFNN